MEKEQEQIIIYEADNGQTQIDVAFKSETVWLSQAQITSLFNRDRTVITRHINNIFKEGELERNQVCANFAHTATDGKIYLVEHYNLDVIISVGYRVKSKRGTQFRIWANKILKEYLLQGYAVNERLLQERTQQLQELKNVVQLQEKVISEYPLNTDESVGHIKIIAQYSRALNLLDDYDHQRLSLPDKGSQEVFKISYNEARKAIDELGKQTKFKGLFWREKDDSFKGSLENIYQTFAGEDLLSNYRGKGSSFAIFCS